MLIKKKTAVSLITKKNVPPVGWNIKNYEKEAGKNAMNSDLRLGVGEWLGIAFSSTELSRSFKFQD